MEATDCKALLARHVKIPQFSDPEEAKTALEALYTPGAVLPEHIGASITAQRSPRAPYRTPTQTHICCC